MIIKREIYKTKEKYINSPEAIIITRIRRTGKTTLLKQILENMPSENKIFFDLENPANQKFFEVQDYYQIAIFFKYE